METTHSKSRLFTYISCAVLFAFSANINFDIVRHYFEQDIVARNYSDFVYFDRGWSAIIATIFLLFTYNKIAAKRIILFFTIIYMVSQVNLIVAMEEYMVRVHYFLLTTAGFGLFVYFFSLMLIETNVTEEMNLAIFFSMVILGFLFSEILNHFLLKTVNDETLDRAQGFNMIPPGIILLLMTFNDSFRIRKQQQPANYLIIARFIELEGLVIFGLFFVLMTILEGHDVFEVTESLVYLTVNTTWCYLCGAVLLLIYPINKFVRRFHIHKLNIGNLSILIVCFLLMPLWSDKVTIGFIVWGVISISMYLLFVSNTLILAEKFDSRDIMGALLLYFFMGAVGFYAGYISIISLEPTLGENALHLSISIVLGTILLYYLLRFVKDRLYEW